MSELSDPFTAMAAQIDLNASEEFGGASVIMMPGEDVKPIRLLVLNGGDNPAVFLSTLQTMIQMAIQDLEDRTKPDPFGGMRR